jgi:hypothetical protein
MNHYANIGPMQSQEQVKYLSLYLNSAYFFLVLLQSKKSYSKSLKIHFFMPYDALNGSFMEKYILP